MPTLPRPFGSTTAGRPRLYAGAAALLLLGAGLGAHTAGAVTSHRGTVASAMSGRAYLPPGLVNHILVIDLENEGYADTFGAQSPAVYLNTTLRGEGELIPGYYATGHFSLDNYIAQVSGQAPTMLTKADCADFTTRTFHYLDVTPGTDDPNPAVNPGQVDGNGCVYPAPNPAAGAHGAPTIADQLDALFPPDPTTHRAAWREYAEDMGADPARDGGVTDPSGGTDCAHPAVGGADQAEVATATDQYATRHNPFLYFHSVIDKAAECDANVVPLGTLRADGTPDPAGHLVKDLADPARTPRFGFITPDLCDDGHDATCTGVNAEGGHTGGLAGADLWLKHWMPMILGSPAYQHGDTLVVLTFDEADANPADPGYAAACCDEQPGPNVVAPGDSTFQATGDTAPGGGQTGALLFEKRYITPGSVDTTGSYNHYSALRSYEDLLGLWVGGPDGRGHLGFAARPGLVPFGPDVFNAL
ncbi:hypothetical protein ABH931_004580 [Streptacidiphilus sp. MAP12-33]|uniref:hypothetical protein n=1 Tax=Streptacidiphilus sp. MAP12-33 TaxID=3156266 RepID=UPI003519B7E7